MAAYIHTIGTLESSSSPISPAWPSHQSGDIAFLIVENSGATLIDLTVPAGFVQMPDSPTPSGGSRQTRQSVYWCRATTGSMSAPTIADSGNHQGAYIVVVRGAIETGNPYDVTSASFETTAGTSHTFTTVTTTVDDCLILLSITRENDSATAEYSAFTNANLTGLAEYFDLGHTVGKGGGFGLGSGVMATAGATGTSTVTSVNTVENTVMTIAVLPGTTVSNTTNFFLFF